MLFYVLCYCVYSVFCKRKKKYCKRKALPALFRNGAGTTLYSLGKLFQASFLGLSFEMPPNYQVLEAFGVAVPHKQERLPSCKQDICIKYLSLNTTNKTGHFFKANKQMSTAYFNVYNLMYSKRKKKKKQLATVQTQKFNVNQNQMRQRIQKCTLNS